MRESLWYIKRCDLFGRLTQEQLADLERHCRIRHFARGETVYLPIDLADSVLLVAAGMVKLCHIGGEGKEAILAFIEPGELFGELSVFGGSSRDELARATEKSTLVLIPRDVFEQLVEASPDFSIGVTRLFGLRRRRIERRLKYLLYQSNRDRLVHLLLELADQFGMAGPAGVSLRIQLSHQDLASIIGSTRETITLLLGELQSEGLLTLGRRKIVLTDLHRLAALVQAPVPGPGRRG